MVSMLPTIDNSLFAIEGGNYQIAEKAIEAANASVVRQEVVQIQKRGNLFSLLLKV